MTTPWDDLPDDALTPAARAAEIAEARARLDAKLAAAAEGVAVPIGTFGRFRAPAFDSWAQNGNRPRRCGPNAEGGILIRGGP